MKRYKLCALFAVALLCCTALAQTKTRKGLPAAKERLLEVYNVRGSEATARLVVDGKVVFTTRAYIGKNGIGKTREGDLKTPLGTFHILGAFGVKPNPGTTLRYRRVTSTTFACDEKGPYSNKIIDTAVKNHRCKGEDMYHLVPQYNYGLITDYNKACVYPKGSHIFIHVKGPRPYTGGCIALDEARMVQLLRLADTTLTVVIRK